MVVQSGGGKSHHMRVAAIGWRTDLVYLFRRLIP